MKILMVALLDAKGESAGKTHFLSLCRCFAARGHDVTALLSRPADAEATRAALTRQGVNVTWSPALQSASAEWLFWGWHL